MSRPAVVWKYVYCIVGGGAAPPLGPIGLEDGVEVQAVSYRDIAALISDTARGVHEPTPENLLRHGRVSERAMAQDRTVIPMAFGTVFTTSEDLLAVLSSAYEALRDVLDKMRDRTQRDLLVQWDPEEVLQELEREDPSLRDLRREITSRPGSTYFARLQYARLIDTLLHERSQRHLEEILRALRDVSEATRTNKPTDERTVLDAAFLVRRQEEEAFDARLDQVAARQPRLTFRCTGPWPPYHFTNMRLKLEGPEPVG